MEYTFRNCVGSICLPYSPEFAKLEMNEQAMTYRKLIKEYKKNDNLKNEINKQANLFDKLDTLPSYEEKKNFLSFFNKLVSNTFILSYAGQIELGEYEEYIESMHTYTSGTTGISMQMLSAGDYITINFMQSFTSDVYINAFAKILEESGLVFSISNQIEYSIPKDSIK
ncbi:MAG: hypothetical protein K0R09_3895 [Clostridiales bacterium]|jgi:hypothetical protein|nr:hypothetical protein [Clostridiales bacterium]MDF2802753.1 hypothetical protein [Anaerocolumna sp.]